MSPERSPKDRDVVQKNAITNCRSGQAIPGKGNALKIHDVNPLAFHHHGMD